MKKIRIPKINITLTYEQVEEINALIEKATPMDGIPAELDGQYCNKCPNCGAYYNRWYDYCTKCGQKLNYVDNDVIPFDSEEVSK